MAYSSKPWTSEVQEPKTLKTKREEIQQKEIQSKVEENLPVSAARIVAFLNKNKDRRFTNKQIASEVGISSSVASGIMDKLEEIGCVKVVKVRKHTAAGISQVYQSAEGTSKETVKEREAEGYIAKVLSVFKNSVNKTYSKKEIAKELGISKDKVGQALSILLVTEKVKVVGIDEDSLSYQNIKGKKPAVEIATEPSKVYMTLSNYLKMNGIKGDIKEFKTKVSTEKGHSRLFYSDRGILKEYEISYLQKVIGLEKTIGEKKGLLERMMAWGRK